MPTINAADKGGFLTQRQVLDTLYAKGAKVLRGLEKNNLVGLMRVYRRAQDSIIAKLSADLGAGPQSYSQWEGERLNALLASIQDILNELERSANGTIGRSSLVQFVNSYDRSVYAMDQATPSAVPATYYRPPEDAIKILVETPYKGAMFSQRIGMITDAMASDIRDELTQSLINGETMAAAAKRVRDIIGIDDLVDPRSYSYRALVIGQTEIMRAQNMARDFSYEQNKDLLQGDGETAWTVAPDDKLCPWCFRREGMTDEEIEATEPPDKDPWGNSSDCPLHPKCRCTKQPKLKSWSDLIGLEMPDELGGDARGMRDSKGDWEIAPVEKFDAWMAAKGIQFEGVLQ